MTEQEIIQLERMRRFDHLRDASRSRGKVRAEINGRRVEIERKPDGLFYAAVDSCAVSATSKALYQEIWG